ncbi:MAG TPA: hypothetical protein DEB37_14915 [Lysinibacillus sp.]|nr:hypothetical protein [Lysinibacillus sp.]
MSIDPLAVYNPVMESEFYGDGQHNGGVFYSGNLNPYIYTYQNPTRYIDPNGKQTESYATRHDDNDMSQVVTIRGRSYYQNTTNTPAIVANKINSWFGGDADYFVEKKSYNGADNRFIHEAVDTSAGTLIGGVGKIVGPLLGNISSKISNRFIPDAGKLLNSMLASSKNGMSAIGRALQKHAGRAGSSFENVIYSGKTATDDAMKIVNDIVTSKPMIDLEKNGTKTFYDKATGRGFNVNRQGGVVDLESLVKGI